MYNFSSNTMVNLYRELKALPSLNKKEEQALFKLVRGGSLAAREKILAANTRFIIKVAVQYKASPVPLPDMVSEGMLGLDRAVNDFDYTRGNRFISYGIWWIRAYIIRAIYERGYFIRLSGNYFTSLLKDYKTDPNKKHISAEMNKIAREYRQEVKVNKSDEQLDNQVTTAHQVGVFLKRLPPGQASILRSIYGLDGLGYLTITDIAELRGVCTETIRRERDRALSKLRLMIKGGK